MNDLANDIKKVLITEAYLSLSQNRHSNPNYQLLVQESDQSASLKTLKITHLNQQDFCFTLDLNHQRKFKTYSAYIDSSTDDGYDQRCDFVIMRKVAQQWHVYFGDLKSTSIKPKKCLKKLRASQLFFNYLLGLSQFNQNWQNPTTQIPQYQAHYLIVHDAGSKPANKNPARAGNTKANYDQISTLKLIRLPLSVMSDGKAKISFNTITCPST